MFKNYEERGPHSGDSSRRSAVPPSWEGRLLAVVTAVLVVVRARRGVRRVESRQPPPAGRWARGFALRQAVGAAVGGLLAVIFARTGLPPAGATGRGRCSGVTVFLLLIPLLPFTHAITPTINGARRWVNLGVLTLQPSELAKLRRRGLVRDARREKGRAGPAISNAALLPFVVILVPVTGLIFLEPHLSMALLVALSAGSVLFTGEGAHRAFPRARRCRRARCCFGAVATAQYRLARVLTFLNPGAAPTEAHLAGPAVAPPASGRRTAARRRIRRRANRSSAYLPVRVFRFHFLARSAKSGASSACSRSRCCSARSVWLGFRIARHAPGPVRTSCSATGITVMIGLTVVLHIGGKSRGTFRQPA